MTQEVSGSIILYFTEKSQSDAGTELRDVTHFSAVAVARENTCNVAVSKCMGLAVEANLVVG